MAPNRSSPLPRSCPYCAPAPVSLVPRAVLQGHGLPVHLQSGQLVHNTYLPPGTRPAMNAQGIADAIVQLVKHSGHSYEKWTVGVTDNPAQRCSDHKQSGRDVSWWHQWNANSEQDARTVERHFLDQGMRGGAGGPGRADYVYVF